MSNRNFGGFITTGTVSANSSYVSGMWTVSQYLYQKANGLWPGSQGYSLFSGNATSVNEGATTTFYANTTNIPNNTTAYWSIQHITTNDSDFVETSNSFVISNNIGSFIVRTVNDLTTEGSETFQIALRQDSNTGPILTTSPTITLSDTSLTPPPSIGFFVIGGGGYSLSSSGYSGGGGAGGAVEAVDFTGYVNGETYTVTVGSQASSSSITGTFAHGADSAVGSGGGAGGERTLNVPTDALSGGCGGGGGAYLSSSYSAGRYYYFFYSSNSAGSNQSGQNATLIAANPGKITNMGYAGGGPTIVSWGSSSLTNGQRCISGPGGGIAGTPPVTTLGSSGYTAQLNGGDGTTTFCDPYSTNYGGGGAGKGWYYYSSSGYNAFGSGGAGGGGSAGVSGSANSGGGGGSGGTNGGSGTVLFRFLDSQITATTTGTVTSVLSGSYRYLKFTSSGTISFTPK